MSENRVQACEPRALLKQLESRAPLHLLDVREPAERSLSFIPASGPARDHFVPIRQIIARFDELNASLAADPAPVVVYCHHGVRSLDVAHYLASRGVENVWNLEGGIDAYSLQADPRVPRY